jgi:hypothetical protein
LITNVGVPVTPFLTTEPGFCPDPVFVAAQQRAGASARARQRALNAASELEHSIDSAGVSELERLESTVEAQEGTLATPLLICGI